MRYLIVGLVFALLLGIVPARAQYTVVADCSLAGAVYAAGQVGRVGVVDVNGRQCHVNAPQANVDTAALITHTAASVGLNGADQNNAGGHGINVVINITAITGTTPTLTVTLQGKDQASGAYYTILASAALATTGATVLTVFPGAPTTANVSANAQLPKTWRVITTIGGTTPAVTATIGASIIE